MNFAAGDSSKSEKSEVHLMFRMMTRSMSKQVKRIRTPKLCNSLIETVSSGYFNIKSKKKEASCNDKVLRMNESNYDQEQDYQEQDCGKIKNLQIRKIVKDTRTSAAHKQVIISKLRDYINSSEVRDKLTYLSRPGVLEWIFAEPTFIKELSNETEKEWGKKMIGGTTNNWTTNFCETLVKDILLLIGENPRRIEVPKKGANGKELRPDWETDNMLYEVKARTYSTTGSAGEKLLAVPVKYAECKRLYGKGLRVVCIGYQEIEADRDFCLFDPQAPEHIKQLEDAYKNNDIKFVRATDLLKGLVSEE